MWIEPLPVVVSKLFKSNVGVTVCTSDAGREDVGTFVGGGVCSALCVLLVARWVTATSTSCVKPRSSVAKKTATMMLAPTTSAL